VNRGELACDASVLHESLIAMCRVELAEFRRHFDEHGDALLPVGWVQIGIELHRPLACGCVFIEHRRES